jgi:protein involved in polysaccharide export with SLBB domain
MATASASSKSIDCDYPVIRRKYAFMNFLSKWSLFGCAAILAGMIFSGCASSSTDEPTFSDNPGAPASMGESATTTNDVQVAADAARFQAGETVVVGTSTGTDTDPGPIAMPGQPYLISDDGTISLPLIGRVQAAGKTPGELQDEINSLYVPQYYIRMTTTVTSPNRVYTVGGEVMRPGPQVYIGGTTVTTAIQAAGDLTQFASHTKVWLTRKDGTRIRVNYDKALEDSTQDPQVFPGDKIEVRRRYL